MPAVMARIPGPRCAQCGTPLPYEYQSDFCGAACAKLSKRTAHRRLEAAEREVADLRDLLADVAQHLDVTGVAIDLPPELLARIRAAARPIP